MVRNHDTVQQMLQINTSNLYRMYKHFIYIGFCFISSFCFILSCYFQFCLIKCTLLGHQTKQSLSCTSVACEPCELFRFSSVRNILHQDKRVQFYQNILTLWNRAIHHQKFRGNTTLQSIIPQSLYINTTREIRAFCYYTTHSYRKRGMLRDAIPSSWSLKASHIPKPTSSEGYIQRKPNALRTWPSV